MVSPAAGMRICIATTDIVGPVRNGGVGTALTGLAEALAEGGHQVTILYASTLYRNGSLEEMRRLYGAKGIAFDDLSGADRGRLNFQPTFDGPAYPVIDSYLTYEALRGRSFDVIHFPDYKGLGFYSAMAK